MARGNRRGRDPVVAERRLDLLAYKRENPGVSYAELGEIFGVSEGTARFDEWAAIRAIAENLDETVVRDWRAMVTQERMNALAALRRQFDAENQTDDDGRTIASPNLPAISNAIDKQLTGIEKVWGLHNPTVKRPKGAKPLIEVSEDAPAELRMALEVMNGEISEGRAMAAARLLEAAKDDGKRGDWADDLRQLLSSPDEASPASQSHPDSLEEPADEAATE